MQNIKLGAFELTCLDGGYLTIDSGGVFGALPKTIWGKDWPADEQNQIQLAIHPIVIKTNRDLILVDCGAGDKFDSKQQTRYGIHQLKPLEASLNEANISKNDVTIAILTHLHYDHVGGATHWNKDGVVVPTCPKARYLINRIEWQTAQFPDKRSKSSYLPENFLPLKPRLELCNGTQSVAMGVSVMHTGGHTRGHQAVFVESCGQKAIIWGDLLPTRTHASPGRIMAFDLYPVDSSAFKEKWISRAITENWLSIFNHDPQIPAGFIRKNGDAYSVQPIE